MAKGLIDRWSGYWLIWGLVALYFTSWDLVVFASKPSMWPSLLLMNLAQNAVWGALGLILVILAERWPIESLDWKAWKVWGLHLTASVLIAALGLFLAFLISLAFGDYKEFRMQNVEYIIKYLLRFFRQYYHSTLLLMLAVVGIFQGLRLYRKLKAQELESARLEARFGEAQNLALRMQLQPHFLFNTLNSISALVHIDPEAADRMIVRLGDFLRMTLDEAPSMEVPLRKEMAFLDAYLSIERIRFGDRLKVVTEIPSNLETRRVPAFILQPLVENALKHGLASLPSGTLRLRARHESGYLVLEVQDDGVGQLPGREGRGLNNVRSRLGLIYKGRGHVDILSSPGKGTLVALRLPLEEDGGEGA